MVVVMVVKSFLKLDLYVELPTWLGGLMTIITTTLLSILIAHLSYRYFESYFLRKKEKFSVIKTG
jgi:peptidoglycan/LPS O-acetylase OafA/YrhL